MVESRTISSALLMAQANSEKRIRAYCAYGYRAPEKGVLTGFNGECWESVSHGYLLGNGYRLYSPILRRFLSVDSYSPFGEGGLNTYTYCAGDPVNRIDPSGHKFSVTGGLKAVGLMKRTGRTLRSEVSVLSYGEQKSQPEIKSYRVLNVDPEGLRNQIADVDEALRSMQIQSVVLEYVTAETIGELGDLMRQHFGPDAKDIFIDTQQRILDQSLARIRQGQPPRRSVSFSEERTATS